MRHVGVVHWMFPLMLYPRSQGIFVEGRFAIKISLIMDNAPGHHQFTGIEDENVPVVFFHQTRPHCFSHSTRVPLGASRPHSLASSSRWFEYLVIYSFRWYPRVHVTAVRVEKYYKRIRGHNCISFSIWGVNWSEKLISCTISDCVPLELYDQHSIWMRCINRVLSCVPCLVVPNFSHYLINDAFSEMWLLNIKIVSYFFNTYTYFFRKVLFLK
jgi:hypothetical protein